MYYKQMVFACLSMFPQYSAVCKLIAPVSIPSDSQDPGSYSRTACVLF